jgi:hypothetical protein
MLFPDFTCSQAVSMEEESNSPTDQVAGCVVAENRGGLIKSLDADEAENRSDRGARIPSGILQC